MYIAKKKKSFTSQSKDIKLDMTTMLDFIFILLIFFVISASFAPLEHLNITLPQAEQTNKNADSSSSIHLIIKDTGAFEINGKKLKTSDARSLHAALLEIQETWQATKTSQTKPKLTISADENAPYKSLVTSLDVTGQMGFFQVLLQVRKK